ncbi:MAG: hypothetical protein U5K75_02935, partial [Ahrensia sp.]|nr:hypothetical protein [Ahrensia sp.]
MTPDRILNTGVITVAKNASDLTEGFTVFRPYKVHAIASRLDDDIGSAITQYVPHFDTVRGGNRLKFCQYLLTRGL